jgi:NLI interacting factor-like phosphatase
MSRSFRHLGAMEWLLSNIQTLTPTQPFLFNSYLHEYFIRMKPDTDIYSLVLLFAGIVHARHRTSSPIMSLLISLLKATHSLALAELETHLHTDPEISKPSCKLLKEILGSKLPAQHPVKYCKDLILTNVKKLCIIHKKNSMYIPGIAGMLTTESYILPSSIDYYIRFKPAEPQSSKKLHKLTSEIFPITLEYEVIGKCLSQLSQETPPPTLTPDSDDLQSRLLVVLDLDETLVHYDVNSGLLFRPGVVEFLTKLSEIADIAYFTAACEDYGSWAMDQLEISGAPKIKWRFFRHHAIPFGSVFLKDLNKVAKETGHGNLNRICIVDNLSDNYALQMNHGINCSTWMGDLRDNHLLSRVFPLLKILATSEKCVSVPEILGKVRDTIKGGSVVGEAAKQVKVLPKATMQFIRRNVKVM